ncbi:MAG: hydrogenase expression/formation protein HypE [Candidatus Omnitrophota bacterium]
MDKITLGHGSGGKLMHNLIDSLFLDRFSNPILRNKADSAVLKIKGATIAFTTDSFVVDPIFFPGGDIGSLAVYGTVNDLSVCGARPLYISCGIIIEEGLDRGVLGKIVNSMRAASQKAGVRIVTGDTKVVEKGKCDKVFINTSGIGIIEPDRGLSARKIRPGDAIIVNGTIGEHAISILTKREGLRLDSKVASDAQPLNGLIRKVLTASRGVRFMRDPTRGGLAATLNEIVKGAPFGISIDETRLPIGPGVRAASELLGLDPLNLANEGKVIFVVDRNEAAKVVRVLKRHTMGKRSAVIGRIERKPAGIVFLNTSIGSRRIVDMPSGVQLPRIC